MHCRILEVVFVDATICQAVSEEHNVQGYRAPVVSAFSKLAYAGGHTLWLGGWGRSVEVSVEVFWPSCLPSSSAIRTVLCSLGTIVVVVVSLIVLAHSHFGFAGCALCGLDYLDVRRTPLKWTVPSMQILRIFW